MRSAVPRRGFLAGLAAVAVAPGLCTEPAPSSLRIVDTMVPVPEAGEAITLQLWPHWVIADSTYDLGPSDDALPWTAEDVAFLEDLREDG